MLLVFSSSCVSNVSIGIVEVISRVLKEFPSENEVMKKDFLKNSLLAQFIPVSEITANKTEATKKTSQLILTAAAIPIVIAPKYTDSSNGDLTGFRNLTIDSAPTMPNDKAIFPDITLVITNTKIGRSVIVEVCAIVLIHTCPKTCNRIRSNIDIIINIIMGKNISKFSISSCIKFFFPVLCFNTP